MVSYLGGVHTLHVDAFVIRVHVTSPMIMSQREHTLDRWKSESEGAAAANEARTCAVPMYAPQTSSRWHGVGEVSSACEVGCGRMIQPRLLSGEGNPRLLLVKRKGCGSNSKVDSPE